MDREGKGDMCHRVCAQEAVGPHRTAPGGGVYRPSVGPELPHEHLDTPSGQAARRARWHEKFAEFDLSVVYVRGKTNTVSDGLSRWTYPAGRAWMDMSSHGDAQETEEARQIIDMEQAMEQDGVKCFVVMTNRTGLAKFWGA